MNSFHLDKICAKCLHINTGRVIVKPDIPDIPDIPDKPDNPDNPDNPNNPDNPDNPNNPENPGGGSDIPDNPDIPPTVEEEEYTITLYTYGQTDGESSEFTIKVENGIITTPLPQPTRQGYTFDGWYDEPLEGGNKITPSSHVDNNTVLYEHWTANTYSITLNPNGGIWSPDTYGDIGGNNHIIQVECGSDIQPLKEPDFVGHTFVKWEPDFPTVGPSQDITCVAQWIVNKYPICFDANGGTGGEQNEMEYGSELVPPEVELENHIFLGWVPEVPSTVPDHEMTFVAQWEEIPIPKINITFDANGGVGGETLELEVGTPIVPPTVTKEGHTFVGWDKQVPDVAPDEDTTYVATWTVNQYQVQFDANGGTGSTTLTLDYGSRIVPPSNVSRVGHTFNGWQPQLLETVPARNLAYVAKWLVNRYAIAFDMNGGQTNGETTMELEYGSPIQAPTPTRTGHTFNGWSPSVPSEVPVGGGTYVAQWTPNQYVVTFDANGGEGGTQETMEYGAEITPPTVTKEGYVFNGWMPEVDSVVPANDVTYVAQWEEEYEPPFDDPVGLPEVDLESPPDSDFQPYEAYYEFPDTTQRE